MLQLGISKVMIGRGGHGAVDEALLMVCSFFSSGRDCWAAAPFVEGAASGEAANLGLKPKSRGLKAHVHLKAQPMFSEAGL